MVLLLFIQIFETKLMKKEEVKYSLFHEETKSEFIPLISFKIQFPSLVTGRQTIIHRQSTAGVDVLLFQFNFGTSGGLTNIRFVI